MTAYQLMALVLLIAVLCLLAVFCILLARHNAAIGKLLVDWRAIQDREDNWRLRQWAEHSGGRPLPRPRPPQMPTPGLGFNVYDE